MTIRLTICDFSRIAIGVYFRMFEYATAVHEVAKLRGPQVGGFNSEDEGYRVHTTRDHRCAIFLNIGEFNLRIGFTRAIWADDRSEIGVAKR